MATESHTMSKIYTFYFILLYYLFIHWTHLLMVDGGRPANPHRYGASLVRGLLLAKDRLPH